MEGPDISQSRTVLKTAIYQWENHITEEDFLKCLESWEMGEKYVQKKGKTVLESEHVCAPCFQ
jgi:hypothetical protein